MKKIKLLLVVAICSFLTLSCGLMAHAEDTESGYLESSTVETVEDSTSGGETANESGVLDESEEILDESEIAVESGSNGFTDEDYKNHLDNLLTENQKEVTDKVTEIITDKLNISNTVVYCIVGSILLVAVFLFTLIGKNTVKNGKIKKLEEQNKAVVEMAKKSDKDLANLLEVYKSISTDGIEKTIAEKNKQLEDELLSKLKLDSDTITSLLVNGAKTIDYLEKFFEYFKTMAIKKGDTALINSLAETPDATRLKEQELLIAKIKAKLGDEAFDKLLEE